MNLRRFLGNAITALVVIGVIALIIGQLVGQPILLSYVETGSMKPALDPGDGFVALPQAVAGPVEKNDVVVFRAEELHGGGLTTHRVVGETDRGYITKGDANPFTDQDGGEEPPVKEAQIVAQGLTVKNNIIVIPHLGDLVTAVTAGMHGAQQMFTSLLGTDVLGIQSLGYFLFILSAIYYLVGSGEDRKKRPKPHQNRDTGLNTHIVVGTFTLLLIIGATIPMVVPAGSQEYAVVSAEFESASSQVIVTGESKSLNKSVGNGGKVPVVVYLEPASEGVDVQPRQMRLEGGEMVNTTVTLYAPRQTGYYRRFVTQHRYLAVLPQSILTALYRLHPWMPIVAINALIGIPFYAFGVALVGSSQIRGRSRSRNHSFWIRLCRLLRGLY